MDSFSASCSVDAKTQMRIRIGLALAMVMGAAISVRLVCNAQTPHAPKEAAPDLKSFVGTWKATFNGEVFATLTIRENRGDLAGSLNNFDLSVDKDGSLSDGTHKDDGDAPLLNPHFKSGALIFVVMQKDQYAPSTEWKFIPKSATEGELTPLVAPQISGPKDVVVQPIRMIRERAKP